MRRRIAYLLAVQFVGSRTDERLIRLGANPKMVLDTRRAPLQNDGAINVVSDIAQRYQLSSLQPFIQSCRELTQHDELSVAVIGRFKAGKNENQQRALSTRLAMLDRFFYEVEQQLTGKTVRGEMLK
jgi:hypothetical protein